MSLRTLACVGTLVMLAGCSKPSSESTSKSSSKESKPTSKESNKKPDDDKGKTAKHPDDKKPGEKAKPAEPAKDPTKGPLKASLEGNEFNFKSGRISNINGEIKALLSEKDAINCEEFLGSNDSWVSVT